MPDIAQLALIVDAEHRRSKIFSRSGGSCKVARLPAAGLLSHVVPYKFVVYRSANAVLFSSSQADFDPHLRFDRSLAGDLDAVRRPKLQHKEAQYLLPHRLHARGSNDSSEGKRPERRSCFSTVDSMRFVSSPFSV